MTIATMVGFALLATACGQGGDQAMTAATRPADGPAIDTAVGAEPAPAELALIVPEEGPLISYEMPIGECQTCDFVITFDASGSARYVANSIAVELAVDAADLDRLVRSTSLGDLVIGRGDCGREVDGNAPILRVLSTEIDTCYETIDDDHPLVRFVHEAVSSARAEAPAVVDVRAGELDAPWRFDDLRREGPIYGWPTIFDPDVCEVGIAEVALDLGSAWMASDVVDGSCLLWLGGETENPFYDGLPTTFCQFPPGHIPVEIYLDDGGPAWVWSPWCDTRVELPASSP